MEAFLAILVKKKHSVKNVVIGLRINNGSTWHMTAIIQQLAANLKYAYPVIMNL